MSVGILRRLFRGDQRVRQRPDWPAFVGPNWLDNIMDVDITDNFHAKQGRSTGRWIINRDGRRLSVYLKRHYCLPRWQGLLATLWPGSGWSPALQEAQHLDWACRHGLPVPDVVAAGETIGPWGRLQSFLAVEELTGMVPLHLAIPAAFSRLAPAAFENWKRGLAAEIARLTRELHSRRCFHKDLYLCHFYIPHDDTQSPPSKWRGRIHLIDFHRLGHHSLLWRLWQVKDLGELMFSSEVAGITGRDRVRFWRNYLGTDRHRQPRWLPRLVLFKWRRYRRHNQKLQAA